MKLLKDLGVSGKTVFLRSDLDVPIKGPEDSVEVIETEQGTRLTNLKPTVDYLLAKGAKVVIAGHIDRPQRPDPSKSTRLLLDHLKEILARDVVFKEDLSPTIESPIVLLENLRFWPGEIENSQEFAQKLAGLAQVYVNEAFGNCHRAHASMVQLPAILPHAAGLHLEKEVEVLSNVLNYPQKPFLAIVGGAKIETKVPLIENLAHIADHVLVGGELPVEIKAKGKIFAQNVSVAQMSEGNKELADESIDEFVKYIKGAKTIIWNGPHGLFEEGFNKATLAIANAIIESGAYSVVGGGETSQFLTGHKLISKFSFVSAGGGAMLEFLSGHQLPGIKALE